MKIFKKMILAGLVLISSQSKAMNQGIVQAFSALDDNSKALVITGIAVVSGACYLANKLCSGVDVAYNFDELSDTDSDWDDRPSQVAPYNPALEEALRVLDDEGPAPTVSLKSAPVSSKSPVAVIGRSYQEVYDQLAQGVLEGDLSKVRAGIASGCNVHQKLSDYRSLRHFAYNREINRALIAAGAESEVDFWDKKPEDYTLRQKKALVSDMLSSRY